MIYIGIDPSTKTGFVVLNEQGEVVEAKEITFKGVDPERMATIIQDVDGNVQDLIRSQDYTLCIEGFSYGSKGSAVSIQYGLGWGIRTQLFRVGIDYIEITPTALKKFTGAGGNAPKERVSVEVYKRWGFESKSNNITDAFVLAQIGRYLSQQNLERTKFQDEVLKKISI